jgi:hypothetical protein
LAAPPQKGSLHSAITALAERTWQHPISGEPTRFGFSTIERWYYRALKETSDPVAVLRRKLRADVGRQSAISGAVRQALIAQYASHKSWSVQLHHDNLVALAETNPDLKPVPSYATLRRFLKANGLNKRRHLISRCTEGAERAEARFLDREVRSYEAEYIGGLLHFDAHHCSRKVLDGPARAVRCGRAIVDSVKKLGIHVRVHTGECEVIGEKLGGIAVHIGARIGALAAPDEVLVSRTVSDLVAGSGLGFEERGTHSLKGVPGSWQLLAAA